MLNPREKTQMEQIRQNLGQAASGIDISTSSWVDEHNGEIVMRVEKTADLLALLGVLEQMAPRR